MKIVEIPTKKRPKIFWTLSLAGCLLIAFLTLQYLDGQNSITETEPVSTPEITYQSDFFVDYRLEREAHRSEQEECYRELLQTNTLTEDQRIAYNDQLLQLLKEAQADDAIETILRGRGYEDALLIRGEAVAFLVLRADSLGENEKNDLAALTSAYTAIPAEQLTVYAIHTV